MATRRKTGNDYADELELEDWREEIEAIRRARRRAPAPRPSNARWFAVGLFCTIILLGLALLHFRPDLLTPPTTADAPAVPRPTLSAAQRQTYQQRAGATAAEQQAIQQAQPVEDTSKPPMLPVQATASAIAQPAALDGVPAKSLSPVDLGYRPVPTPTTMLSQEQFEASQASEEQNFLDTSASGQTPAQQMVRVHEAEGNAKP